MKMLKICTLACTMLLGTTVVPAKFTVCAETEETLIYQGMRYEIVDDAITITKATDDLPAEIVIPSEIDGVPVTKIGNNAFSGTSLSKLTVSEGVRKIGYKAFYECMKLEEVYLPASLKLIGTAAFCTGEFTSSSTGVLKTIQVAEDNPYFTSIDGIVYTKDMSKLVQYPNGKVIDDVFEIPESVKTIGAYAIHNARVSVVAPEGLEHIEEYAFWCWGNGYSFQFPPNLKTIGTGAFGNVSLSAENAVLPVSVERIEREAFYFKCPSRVTILNPYCYISAEDTFYTGYEDDEKTHNVTLCGYDGSTTEAYAKKWDFTFESLGSIPEELRDWKTEPLTADSIEWNEDPDVEWYEYMEYDDEVCITGLPGDPDEDVRNYKLPDTINGKPVTCINCQDIGNIASLWLPKYLESIPENDFNKGLVMLKNIFVDPENPNYSDIEGVLFNKDATVLLAFPQNHMVMPGEYSNSQTADYTYIVPDTVKELAKASFFGANVQHVVLPEGLEIIDNYAFWCAGTKELNVPKNVRELDAEVFEGCCDVQAVNVSPESQYFCSEDGVLYNKEKTYLIYVPPIGEIIDRFVIPDTVKKVHWNGFNRPYRELVIPAGLTNIDGGLTSSGIWVSTAEKFIVDENNPVYRSEDGILFEKNSLMIYPPQKNDLRVYRVPEGTISLGKSAIRSNNSLHTLILCEGLEYIGDMCCYDLDELETIYLPDSLTDCGIVLSDCERLHTVYYGGTEEQFEKVTWGLFGDKLLKDVLEELDVDIVYNADGIPENVLAEAEAGEKVSGKCGETMKWTFDLTTDTLTISGKGEMKDYEPSDPSAPWRDYRDAIKTVVIEDGIQNIGEYAFYDCSALTEATVPASVSSIGKGAFGSCDKLASVTILNPDCELNDSISIIYNEYSHEGGEDNYIFTGFIRGEEDSTAQAYSEKYGYTFEPLGEAPSVPVSGDYNGDGKVTVADAVLLVRFISEDTTLTEEQLDGILKHEPDQDGDGYITIMDVSAFLKKPELVQSA